MVTIDGFCCLPPVKKIKEYWFDYELRPAVTEDNQLAQVVLASSYWQRVVVSKIGEDSAWQGMNDLLESARADVVTWPWPWRKIKDAYILLPHHTVIVSRGDLALTRHYALIDNSKAEALCLSRMWSGPEVILGTTQFVDGNLMWVRSGFLPPYADKIESDIVAFFEDAKPRFW